MLSKLTTLALSLLAGLSLSAQTGVNAYHGSSGSTMSYSGSVQTTSMHQSGGQYGHNSYHGGAGEIGIHGGAGGYHGNGCCAMHEQGVMVYEHAGFRGRSMVVRDDWSVRSWNDSWENLISSIRIPAGYEVEVYRFCDFMGPSQILREDWSVCGAQDFWNDQISSIRVRKVGGCASGAGMGGAMGAVEVYEHSGFHGRSMMIPDLWVAQNWNDFWNDRISSIRIPQGYEVVVFQHSEGGASLRLRGDWTVYDNDFWNDQISRIEVRRIGRRI